MSSAEWRRSEPITGTRSRVLGFGLPSPAKFQSGRVLPAGLFSVSRPIPLSATGKGSESDMDIDCDSDDDVYEQYSLESSPQDDKLPNVSKGSLNVAGVAVHSEFSSDVNTIQQTQVFRVVRLQPNAKTVTGKDFCGRQPENDNLYKDGIPSAPPIAVFAPEIDQSAEEISTSTTRGMPFPANSSSFTSLNETYTMNNKPFGAFELNTTTIGISDQSTRTAALSSSSLPSSRFPTFHTSGLGPWYAMISYDACIRLCLYSWAKGCMEPPMFLENGCTLLRNAFSLQQVLLPSEEELLNKKSSELVCEKAALKLKKTFGKMKVQVRKVKMGVDPPPGCSFPSLKPSKKKLELLRFRWSNVKSTILSEWEVLQRAQVVPQIPANGSLLHQSLAYIHAGARHVKDMSGLLKVGVATLYASPSPYEAVRETYSCLLRLKSSSEEDAVRLHPGSGETHVFLPDGLGDDLILEVFDSNGKGCGRAIAQVAEISDELGEKLRWCSIYNEPEHELIGRIQLQVHYSTGLDDNSKLKCGSVAETVVYDMVLEAAMKAQQFQQRHLLLHGSWKWLVTEFAVYYGVSDAYTKLRYLSYVMDVATPTADCLELVYELLLPVVMKRHSKHTLSHQENRILGEISCRVEQTIAITFENYKSLDESLPLGMVDVFRQATGLVAPALAPALKLYNLLHDILSPEAQLKFCRYFQTAAKKRSKGHLTEIDEFISNNDKSLLDSVTFSTAYQKMKSLCMTIRNEIATDIEIHNQHVLPSFLELPNLSATIYSAELCSRLHAFLMSFTPSSPSPPVAELVIATADFQRDLASWKINSIKGGVDAKELFHSYIIRWIKDKRLVLLESCKTEKVKWNGVRTQHSTTPYIDDMYGQLTETLNEYGVIISRWPEYASILENAIADVEKAIVETLEKQFADVLVPLKENATPFKLGIKYVQKIAKGSICAYTFPDELGILLNSMQRMLHLLRPKVEEQLKSWSTCIPEGGNVVPGESLGEVTVILRTKFRNYLQAVVEKLSENTKLQNATKLKKIILDVTEDVKESDVRSRMQPLRDLLIKMIDGLHSICETHVFVIICRGLWDRMGQDVLRFVESTNENKSWYKSSRVAVSVLDDTFASEMQRFIGKSELEENQYLQPPSTISEVRAMLCKDALNSKDNNYYF